MNLPLKRAVIALAAAVAIVGLSACSSESDSKTPAPAASPSIAGPDVALVEEGTELKPAEEAETSAPEDATATPAPEVEDLKAAEQPSMAGTRWTGTSQLNGEAGRAVEVSFDATGEVAFATEGYRISEVTWTRVGDDVTITTGGGFATMKGTISQDAISVTGANIAGATLALELKKN